MAGVTSLQRLTYVLQRKRALCIFVSTQVGQLAFLQSLIDRCLIWKTVQ